MILPMTLLMSDYSDNLINMKKTMTATEVARNFSDVLDAVVAGDEITITRGKRPIAVLGSVKDEIPNSVRLADALKEHFEKYRDVPVDDSFDAAEYIRQMRDEGLARDQERQEYLDELSARPYRDELD
jgi:prevent-host-death family protein